MSLSAHLRAPEDHARLPFHPDCPVCRSERLTGVLPPAGVVSLRTQAVLAAGVLAFSAAAPAAALAAEPDQEQQGAAAPGQSGERRYRGQPRLRPRRRVHRLAAGRSTGAAARGAVRRRRRRCRPARPGAGKRRRRSGGRRGRRSRRTERAATRRARDSPGPPSAGDPEQPAPPTSPGPTADAPPAATRCAGLAAHERRFATPGARAPSGHDAGGEEGARPSPSAGARLCPQCLRRRPRERAALGHRRSDRPSTADVQRRRGGRGSRRCRAGRRARTSLARGESLWSIARDMLGGTASTAQIAREVNRLWELNKDRIGTGDRNLLMVGTRLRLR